MTDRNELERLLAAATEGPFSGIYKNYNVRGNMRAIVNDDRYPIAFVPAWDDPEDGEVEASAEGEANAALIVHLVNNAPAILALVEENARLRGENYKTFTDGMEAAAEICGSMAETTYDDADGFEAATGCEAAIMRVVKSQRAEQKKIARQALGETHDR